MTPINWENIPRYQQDQPRWTVWYVPEWLPGTEKPKKVIRLPSGESMPEKYEITKNTGTFAQVREACKKNPRFYPGFWIESGDGLIFLDYDGTPGNTPAIPQIPSYCEYSVYGYGYHVLGWYKEEKPEIPKDNPLYTPERYLTGHWIIMTGSIVDNRRDINDVSDFLKKYAPTAKNNGVSIPFTVPAEAHEGERHPTLKSMVASMVAKKYSFAAILAAAKAENLITNKPPKPTAQIEKETVSLYDWATKREITKQERKEPRQKRGGTRKDNEEIPKATIPDYLYEELDEDGEPTGKYHIDYMKYSDFARDLFGVYNFMGTLYAYDRENSVYKQHINTVETHIRETFKEYGICDRLSSVEREIITHLKSMGCKDHYPFIGRYGTIHVLNGSLDLETGNITAATKENLYDYRIETAYRKFQNGTPELDKFLDQYGTREPIDVLAKGIWQRAYHDTLKELTVFYGPKDSGKTTVAELIQSTLDGDLNKKKNVSRTLLHELLQRFGYASLEGKILNFGDDLPDMFIKNSGRVNELVGSIVRHIEKKCVDGYDTIVTAYYLFTANNLPPLDDDDSVIWGKIHLVEFSKVITTARVPRETLFTQTIKEQLLYRAIEKAISWRETPYTNPQLPDQVRKKWHEASTDVDLFLLEAVVFDPNVSLSLEKVKEHYDQWCVFNKKKRHIKYLQKKIQPFIRRQNTGNVYVLKLLDFKKDIPGKRYQGNL